MRIPSIHAKGRHSDVTMTPMIDVVFLLLIFFVCTASFQIAEETLPTNLLLSGSTVAAGPPSKLELDRVVVKIRMNGGRLTWLIDSRPYDSLEAVAGVLRAVADVDLGVPLVIDAGGDVPLGHVIDLYDLSRQIGFDKIQFAASAPPSL